ncbi:hypothetical protein [Brachybacterium nesterenkovii]|uniref:hypothetical protein n=1 Tax=Brachybacterium nesterenkovii TaxID=47847 RepID=UPI00321A698C
MNNWYEALVRDCYREHDETCGAGASCGVRDDHVRNVYVPMALRDRVEAAEARIKAVREMHGPWEEPGHRVCRVCTAPAEWEETYRAPYPCPTVRALDGEDA